MKDNLEKFENISLVHMPFNREGFDQLKMTDFGVNWPVVYLISSKEKKEMYVGQTHKAVSRLNDHFKDPQRKSLQD